MTTYIVNIEENIRKGEQTRIEIEHDLTPTYGASIDILERVKNKYVKDIISNLNRTISSINVLLPKGINITVEKTEIILKSEKDLKTIIFLENVLLSIFQRIGKLYNYISLNVVEILKSKKCIKSSIGISPVATSVGYPFYVFYFGLFKKFVYKTSGLNIEVKPDSSHITGLYIYNDIYYIVSDTASTTDPPQLWFDSVLFADKSSKRIFDFCYNSMCKILDIPPFIMTDPKSIFLKSGCYKYMKKADVKHILVNAIPYGKLDKGIEDILSINNKISIDKFIRKLKDILDCGVSIKFEPYNVEIEYVNNEYYRSDINKLRKVLRELMIE